MNTPSVEELISTMKGKGLAVFENDSKPFNLNIVGIRDPKADLNDFDDLLVVFWKYQGKWNIKSWSITTYPGPYYLKEKLLDKDGCAILCEGQYRRIYGIAKHRGKYDALCQIHGEVKVFRDKNKDSKFDLKPESIEEGWFGINIHKSVEDCAVKVGSHSAGCQVFKCGDSFKEFMDLCKKSRDNFGNRFTYTLLRYWK